MTADFSFLKDLFRWEKRLVFRFVATSLGRAAFSMIMIFVMQEFLGGQMAHKGRLSKLIEHSAGQYAVAPVLTALLLASYLASSWLNYANRLVVQQTVKVMELGVSEQLIGHLLKLSVPYFDSESHADLVQAVRMDVTHLRMMVQAVAAMILEGVTVVGMGCVLLWLSPKLAIWTGVSMCFAMIPERFLAERVKRRSLGVRHTGNLLFESIFQIIAGIRVIRVYGGEKTELRNSLERGSTYFDAMMEITRLRALGKMILETLSGMEVALIITLGGYYVKTGQLSWPSLFAFVMAVRALHGPLSNLHNYHSEINMYHAAASRIKSILATPPEIEDRPGALPLPSAPAVVNFENVSFGYDSHPVLHNISFTIKTGETIGVVGPSGAGKSTLVGLLVRFYDPRSGRVLYEGTDIRDYRLADVYDKIAIVTQDPFLFSSTIRDNIRSARPSATQAEVEDAARAAFIHDVILSLPEGYDTRVGVGGRELSRGQAQRINVARAVLKNAPMLVLDEATSSLDSVSEAEVQKALDALMPGRTTFVVAHRFSTLRNVDRFIVLDAGSVVGIGTADELLDSCDLFRELWRLNGITDEETSTVLDAA